MGGQCSQMDTGYCGYESSAAAVPKVEQALPAGRLTHRVTLLAHVCKTERTQTRLLVAAREAHQRNTETLHRRPPHHHHRRRHFELWLCISHNSMHNVFAATYNQGKSLGTRFLLAAQKSSLKLKWVFTLRNFFFFLYCKAMEIWQTISYPGFTNFKLCWFCPVLSYCYSCPIRHR